MARKSALCIKTRWNLTVVRAWPVGTVEYSHSGAAPAADRYCWIRDVKYEVANRARKSGKR